MEDRLLTPDQAAEVLSISPRTLEGWRRKGVGPPYVIYSSRCIRYSEKTLREWLALRSVAARKGRPEK
jgi:predicted site-specific integrase-resolvase